MSAIDKVLAERGSRYGEFVDHAAITQGIKLAMAQGKNWGSIDADMKECLEMIAHKAGRILNGDPSYIDSWTDIIGYTRLVEKRLIAEQATAKSMIAEEEGCPACRPANQVSLVAAMAALSEMFGGAPKGPAPKETTPDSVNAALKTLLAAGVISHAAV